MIVALLLCLVTPFFTQNFVLLLRTDTKEAGDFSYKDSQYASIASP